MNSVEKNYQNALDYLYHFVDYSLTRNFNITDNKFDLTRMYDLLELLGNPQRNYRVIHVAGTKGKGSTCAMIANILFSAGYRTGFYSSPHLHDFCERIQINNKCISHFEFVNLLEEIKPAILKVQKITTFEIATALAFLYFSRKSIDTSVIEVGLGGRLDATNVIDPLVSVITSISYDHTAVLGDTLSKIAFEKAGIIKPEIDVVLAPQAEEAKKVFLQITTERGSPVTQVGIDYLFTPISHSLKGQTFKIWKKDEKNQIESSTSSKGKNKSAPIRYKIPLLGYHQIVNAVTAYAAIQIARNKGMKITSRDIEKGFSRVKWPGRFEILRFEPPVIADSAHNRDSALQLRLALDEYLPEIPIILVFGASEDKDIEGMFAELLPRVEQIIATKSNHPRAIEPDELVKYAIRYAKHISVIPAIENALREADKLAQKKAAILITGSIFVVATAKDKWNSLQETRKNKGRNNEEK
jgi:dihydrofolate synthase/folylpolyglutamate synthase